MRTLFKKQYDDIPNITSSGKRRGVQLAQIFRNAWISGIASYYLKGWKGSMMAYYWVPCSKKVIAIKD